MIQMKTWGFDLVESLLVGTIRVNDMSAPVWIGLWYPAYYFRIATVFDAVSLDRYS